MSSLSPSPLTSKVFSFFSDNNMNLHQPPFKPKFKTELWTLSSPKVLHLLNFELYNFLFLLPFHCLPITAFAFCPPVLGPPLFTRPVQPNADSLVSSTDSSLWGDISVKLSLEALIPSTLCPPNAPNFSVLYPEHRKSSLLFLP